MFARCLFPARCIPYPLSKKLHTPQNMHNPLPPNSLPKNFSFSNTYSRVILQICSNFNTFKQYFKWRLPVQWFKLEYVEFVKHSPNNQATKEFTTKDLEIPITKTLKLCVYSLRPTSHTINRLATDYSNISHGMLNSSCRATKQRKWINAFVCALHMLASSELHSVSVIWKNFTSHRTRTSRPPPIPYPQNF